MSSKILAVLAGGLILGSGLIGGPVQANPCVNDFGPGNAPNALPPTQIGGFDVCYVQQFIDARQSGHPEVVGNGGAAGTFVQLGVGVVETNGTTATALFGSEAPRPMPFQFSPVTPFQFSRLVGPGTNGVHFVPGNVWTFQLNNPAINGGASAFVNSGPLDNATPPPFVSDVQLTGGGLTPTISWQLPANYAPGPRDGEIVLVFDRSHLTPNGAAPVISRTLLPASATSLSMPAGVLTAGTQYTLSVQEIRRRADDPGLPSVVRNDPDIGVSRSFVDFIPLPDGSTATVALPVVQVDPNNPGRIASYGFNLSVQANQPVVLDPLVAIGYDFAIGASDPNFASVTLPNLPGQINPYELLLFDGSNFVFDANVAPGTEFDFAPGGVPRFEVLGIDPGLGLDPNNPTAFLPTLTFAGPGRFTGTMSPITEQVPEPATLVLFGAALAGLAGLQRKAKRR